MRIVDRTTFIGLPAGTWFCKGKPWVWQSLCLKHETLIGTDGKPYDWIYQNFDDPEANDSGELFDRLEEMRTAGASYPMEDATARDGCYNDDDIFLIYERGDLERLVTLLQNSLATE